MNATKRMRCWPTQTHHKRNVQQHSKLSARLIRDTLIGIGVAIALLTAGCSTVAPKGVYQQEIAFDQNVQNAGVIDCDPNGCIVTPGWMQRYGAMQKQFRRSIYADKTIKAEGANYRVSYEVIENFAQMRAAQRGP